jgi:alanine transaminase
MIPTPQYPLYSASITLLNGAQVGYYLDEETGWSLSVKELERSYKAAKDKGVHPRALVIINPGNPTGQCLDEDNMKEIVRFCHKNQLVLLADEVYQENVYIKHQKPFISFKKIVCQMKSEVPGLELVSFHSTSKGIIGECGKRGGYAELHQINAGVKAELYKLSSINLCPNVLGQIMMFLMVNPPQPGEESWSEYEKERDDIFEGLKRRAQKLSETLNSLEGVSCNPPEGAMYAFPRIRLPKKAIEAAKKEKKLPDAFYCLRLLEETGICVVPGSGFGQVEGTWHFRTTFLPREDKIDLVSHNLKSFHKSFMDQYRD